MAVDPRARRREPSCREARGFHGCRGTTTAAARSPRGPTRPPPARRRRRPRGHAASNDEASPLPSPLLRARTRAATILRANPYPEVTDRFCRLPLPTLVYAARGCSPRRPAADIGTNQHEDSAWPSLGFSRSAWESRTSPQRATLFALASLSPG